MDHFEYRGGELHAEAVPFRKIADSLGTPFYCYSTATLTRHYNVLTQSLAPLPHRVCYAVKANGSLAVIRTLAKLGAGADVVSEGEIRLALAAGVPASKIVFSGVGKTASEMAYALEQGIFQFNLESEPELALLSEVAVSKGAKANIAVRINPDVVAGTHAKISTGQKESKFGISISRADAIYAQAATLPGIEVQGVSVHIGSQLVNLDPFVQAFVRVREFVGQLRGAGHNIRTVDLGGGLGIPYGSEEPPLPQAYAEVVKREMQGIGAELVFEPGRLLVGNAGVLVTRVIYVKHTEGKIFVIVDAGMNDLLRPTLYHAYHDIVYVRVPAGDAPTELVDVVGPVCETGDFFAEKRLLKLPRAGDLLAIRSAGAYGASMASTYNARLLVPEVMVNGDEFAVIRPRQTYEEMLAAQVLPPWL